MRMLIGFVALVLSTMLGMTVAWAQAPTKESVLQASDAFMRAYGSGAPGRSEIAGEIANPSNNRLAMNDYKVLIDQFDANANFAGTLQPFWLRGKVQIAELWARYFARYPDRRLIFRDQDIQVHDNVSIDTGYAEMYMGTDPGNSVVTFMRYSITRVHQGNSWKIVNMMIDRLPAEQPLPGVMPPWANSPARSATPSPAR